MAIHRLEREQRVAQSPEAVFAFFAQARNLELITPPWLRFEVLSSEPIEMEVGTRIDYRLRYRGAPLRWTSRIEEWEPESGFVDRQVRGPYRLWHHRHTFAAAGAGTLVRDEVHYELPLGPVGELAHPLLVGRDVRLIFDYRQRAVPQLLDALAATRAG
ncbi:MAG: SRPBCC family protein [Solirubrobacterales bacterium]|nr:SRPBCC family protein [Solirubrobacterales bacterium]